MSRIGKLPISIPKGVDVKITDKAILVKGKLGELSETIPSGVNAVVDNDTLNFTRVDDQKQHRINHGMIRSIVSNMVKGVSEGFTRNLNIIGVGYRAEMKGNFLVLSLGYSHPIYYELPKGVTAEVQERGVLIVLKAYDKIVLGQTASEIRAFRPPEPYKGKGIRYQGERVRQKEGKAKG
ncbi:MAG: 50S ribosomal protein L6 [Deltaproteobacteria bacterium]|nr:50S ribosomal protein L6 [Deltaproteobacteria bacterium]